MKELLIEISMEDLARILPAGSLIEDVFTEERSRMSAGGPMSTKLYVRVMHRHAPVSQPGQLLMKVRLNEAIEDFGQPPVGTEAHTSRRGA